MSVVDDEFFSENITNINKMVSKILLSANVIPLLFLVLTPLGVFEISYKGILQTFAYTLSFSGISYFLQKRPGAQKFLMHFDLIGIALFIAILGSRAKIGIYIAYGFIPFIACLYYNKKLTISMNILGYILLSFSLYRKWQNGGDIFGSKNTDSFLQSFMPIFAGLTIEYFFVFLITWLLSRRNYKTLRHLISAIDDRNSFVTSLKERTIEFQSKNEELKKAQDDLESKNAQLENTQFKIIQFVAECLGSHDLFTGRHVVHTKFYVELIAKKLRERGFYVKQLTDEAISLYASAAFLHDIGKIHIPEGILNKVGKFTIEEFELMKSHPSEGEKLLNYLPQIGDGEFNKIAREMALYHHEKWDGSGYPRKLAGEDIPLCARILAAADVLDALISQRLYKDPMPICDAIEVFRKSSGSHFEPCIANIVIELQNEISEIDRKFKEQETSAYSEELEWWQRYHGLK
ncbi:HD-GYP domain-containing protein [Treponema zioleckii]|uniref:HD-GYP domain-containing protein n=1 Tax=Treponema zioleckii TaxID=331680 RepID=UPI00168BBC95|nr:HD domain-containing phosphohydrolase [Treponema zioleckii]